MVACILHTCLCACVQMTERLGMLSSTLQAHWGIRPAGSATPRAGSAAASRPESARTSMAGPSAPAPAPAPLRVVPPSSVLQTFGSGGDLLRAAATAPLTVCTTHHRFFTLPLLYLLDHERADGSAAGGGGGGGGSAPSSGPGAVTGVAAPSPAARPVSAMLGACKWRRSFLGAASCVACLTCCCM